MLAIGIPTLTFSRTVDPSGGRRIVKGASFCALARTVAGAKTAAIPTVIRSLYDCIDNSLLVCLRVLAQFIMRGNKCQLGAEGLAPIDSVSPHGYTLAGLPARAVTL